MSPELKLGEVAHVRISGVKLWGDGGNVTSDTSGGKWWRELREGGNVMRDNVCGIMSLGDQARENVR
jgi:hypothetical protein